MSEQTSLRVDNVLKLAALIIWRNVFRFFPVALAVMVPQALYRLALSQDLFSADHILLDTLMLSGAAAIGVISPALVEILLVYAILQALNEHVVSLRLSIAWAKPRILSAIVIVLLLECWLFLLPTSFGDFGTSGLLAVSLVELGLWLCVATFFSVAIPTLMVEECGLFDCLRRSIYLTDGFRWQIFAIWLVVILIISGIEYLFISIKLSLMDGFLMTAGQSFANLVELSIFALFAAVVSVVIYSKLRNIKDGPRAESVATVFD